MSGERQACTFTFGDYRLDSREGRLEHNGQEVVLTPTQLEILLVLIDAQGRIVTKQQFMDRVWPGRIVEDGNIARNISTLRKILEDDAQSPRYIETLPSRGYRLLAAVRTDATENFALAHAAPARRRLLTSRRTLIAAFGVTVAGSIVLGAYRVPRGRSIRSLVVLPFDDLSGAADEAYFADGMTEELISNLGRIEALRVTSRTSSMHYKDTRKRLPEIARELGVDGIVEGSVLRASGSVRLHVRLVEASSDRSLWTDTYEGAAAEALALTGSIAQAIARAADVEITADERRRLAESRLVDGEAHEAYLLGLFFENKRNVEALHKAVDYFKQAIEIEPGYAEAYAAMADAYLTLASWQGPSREFWPRARAAAAKALELDDSVALGHLVLAGAALCHDLDAAAAEPLYARALELNPGHELALQRYAYSLMTQGRFNESLHWSRRALERDPVSVAYNTMLGQILHYARHEAEAAEQLEHALELNAHYAWAHANLGRVYLELGRLNEAILELESAYALGGGPNVVGDLGYAYARAGREDEAHEQFRILEAMARKNGDTAFSFALVYLGLGDSVRAFEWLDTAHYERDFRRVLLPVDPIWDDVRTDSRFRRVLADIGLGAVNTA